MAYKTITDLTKRSRGFTITRNYYYDSNDVNSPYHKKSEQEWMIGVADEFKLLFAKDTVDWAVVIFHNRDTKTNKDTGKIEPKGLHVHVVIRYSNSRSISAVMKDFCGNNPRINNCQPVLPELGGYNSALLYLTHHTTSSYKATKEWYHYNEVYSFKRDYRDLLKEHAGTSSKSAEKKKDEDAEKAAIEMIERIGARDIGYKSAKAEYKKTWGAYQLTKYSSRFKSASSDLYDELNEERKQLSANNEYYKRVTFVTGPGRVGKNSIAKGMATHEHGAENVYVPASGNSKKITTDLFDMYEMETVTIMGDVDPLRYDEKAFLNMIDKSEYMPMSSRNESKYWLSDDVYIANDLHPGIFGAYLHNGEKAPFVMKDKDGANALLMFFGRIERWVEYGENDKGEPVIWIRRLTEDLPSIEDVLKYADEKRNYAIDGQRTAELFFDTLGYFEYDNTLKGKAISTEKFEMGPLVTKVYEGDYSVDGFVEQFEKAAIPKNEDQQLTIPKIDNIELNKGIDVSDFA